MNNKRLVMSLASLTAILSACDSDIKIDERYSHVRVYHDDLALACDSSSAVSVKSHGLALINEAIEIHCSQKGHDGLAYPEACGSDTGSINIYTIHYGDLASAENLGFSRLANLPDAQFDEQCEYKVIPDHRKYHLLEQLVAQSTKWQDIGASEYSFEFTYSYSDCPTFDVLPSVKVTVSDDNVVSAYDINNEVFLTDLSNYFTIDELYDELATLLQLTPFQAGLNASEPMKLPSFNQLGVPSIYFIDSGSEECDAINYVINNVEVISSN
ncbi:DUF6174 domain-containing protein [Thalassotalea agariperforans]